MQKTATTDHPIHAVIGERWSPRVFATRPIDPDQLGSLFESARWAPSCFNEQPWSFLVATAGGDRAGFDKMAACLMGGNAWAAEAPVLALSMAKRTFARNGNPNRHAWHDVGLAVGNLITQAQALGFATHQMAGFDGDKARVDLRIPDDYEPVAMIAIGYRGDVDDLSDELAERERAPRERKALDSIVFGAEFGSAHPGF
jgi:nitroreductase